MSLTLKLDVAQVQDGGEQFGDLPGVAVGEHQDLQRRQEVGVLVRSSRPSQVVHFPWKRPMKLHLELTQTEEFNSILEHSNLTKLVVLFNQAIFIEDS